MTPVKTLSHIDGPLADEAWTVYHAAFADLNTRAVQRHLLYRPEFDQILADRRITKYLSFDDRGGLRGLATFTNHLDAWPLISPAYFAHRWPQHYRQRRIWYCGFAAVHPDHHRTSAFADLVAAMWHTAADHHGIIGLDVCAHNGRLSRVIGLMIGRLAGQPVTTSSDVQTFHMYETPGAAA